MIDTEEADSIARRVMGTVPGGEPTGVELEREAVAGGWRYRVVDPAAGDLVGGVDVAVRADDGRAIRIPNGASRAAVERFLREAPAP